MNERLFGLLVVAALTSASAAAADPIQGSTGPAAVYSGGDILTMRGPAPEYVEALVVRDGRIAYAGNKAGALEHAGRDATLVDLQGHTLVPGFIDPHGHMVMASHTLLDADLSGVTSIAELVARMKEHAAEVPVGDRVVGMGYRADRLDEKRHPTREELDSISATRSIMVQDGSGHHGVVNSGMMKELNLTADTPDPEGGVYYRKPGSREMDGHVAESALMAAINSRPGLSKDQVRKGVARAVRLWTENGQTTACEMGLGLSGDDMAIAQQIIDEKLLPIDLVAFAKATATDDAIATAYQVRQRYRGQDVRAELLAARPDLDQRYINRMRLAGVKFWMDGSIDTAFLSQPFTNLPPGVTDAAFRGMQVDAQQQLEEFVERYWNTRVQIAAHANGDQANEQLLIALEKARKKHGPRDNRPIFQHALLLRPDQVERIQALGAIPSFTAGGFGLMGDYLANLIGPEREHWIGVAGTFEKAGRPWTINHDMPAGASPSLIFAMWNMVNRKMPSGRIIAPEQRVSPYAALRSITVSAAHQFREEKTKGSLEVGKLADFVLLDRNPLKVDPMDIKDIQVLRTIKEGVAVYTRAAAPAAPAASVSAMEDAHVQHERLHQLPPARTPNAREQATLETLVAAAEGG